MRKVKLLSGLFALMIAAATVCATAVPANAAVEYMEYDYFYVYKGQGAQVSDKFVKKWDEKRAPMYTAIYKMPGSTVEWYSTETAYWRGRSSTLANATELGSTNVGTERNLSYLSGYGTRLSQYTIAAQYASDNPYNRLELIIYWDA